MSAPSGGPVSPLTRPTASPLLATSSRSHSRGASTRSAGYARSPLVYPQPDERLVDDVELFSLDEAGDRKLSTLSLHDEEDSSSGREMDEEEDDEEGQGTFEHESVHTYGVPRSSQVLTTKLYKTPGFATQLLGLLRDDLGIGGWDGLPKDLGAEDLSIHKVSGSLTNAVFFISYPLAPQPPPTILLRIYGPSSGALISRQTELHILHTLSAVYGIGPRIFGTFENGRVEEYFESRPLDRLEMRDHKMSRWIGRRMKELHTVDVNKMRLPEPASNGPSRSNSVDTSSQTEPIRPPIYDRASNASGISLNSQSSEFSFGSSYSASSFGSRSVPPSPALAAQTGTSESNAVNKKRSKVGSRRGSSSSSGRRAKLNLAVWENITRWTREAKRVFKDFDQLDTMVAKDDKTVHPLPDGSHLNPLQSPAHMLAFRRSFNLPLFEQQVKAYRAWLRDWEMKNGKSKRVFAHNDTQCGNLLILAPKDGALDPEKLVAAGGLRVSHQALTVIDFEYASLNPRGFDIANHFVEFQTDYQHNTLSHTLTHAPYPSPEERRRFYRAYIGSDGGTDVVTDDLDDPATAARSLKREDARVLRLEEEVTVWAPSSHAMWCVWGIIQARDEIVAKIDEWTTTGYKAHARPEETDRPHLERSKSGDIVDSVSGAAVEDPSPAQQAAAADFDYLSYSIGRLDIFRSLTRSLETEA
ncbi:uncharacterized protein L969DRAFT_97447 [Mixia osmundae IAM 14324]|uniref:Choline kinase N-terminal domain-containing protein n=1 Tax=Mixia osmundae (strain CBS 9802 / IAM 14324 / JCM 22182 / KY 12970) TaxID=764103 RepID=G7E4H9_MIXOS|nr:uncharacterized protein L969DRAFT_97447 [Mixia osmundae IAM 14324]KEI36244.1 hypothetical protein L969DRAFT_97447 [Mixia osmundae IAM 14324]GAA97739.1 hypothetical protein E5Q_04418 [Mixia osmundae IAM 14324]